MKMMHRVINVRSIQSTSGVSNPVVPLIMFNAAIIVKDGLKVTRKHIQRMDPAPSGPRTVAGIPPFQFILLSNPGLWSPCGPCGCLGFSFLIKLNPLCLACFTVHRSQSIFTHSRPKEFHPRGQPLNSSSYTNQPLSLCSVY